MSLFDDEMTQACSVQAPTSVDAGGVVTYGTAVSYSCRTWEERKILKLADGETVDYSRVLLLPETATVAPDYKVTVTGDSRAYLVKRAIPQQLLDAETDHFRCYLD